MAQSALPSFLDGARNEQSGEPTNAAPPVEISAIGLHAADGTVLGGTLFTPRARARGTIIIHSATAVPQGYYRRFAQFAAQAAGARVLTYDYRGIGKSRPGSLRGFQATLTDWARLDAAAAHRFVRERFPGEPFAIIGHSFGGQLVGLIDEPNAATGVVMVGAQLAYYRDWPAKEHRRLGFVWKMLVPAASALFGYMPGRLGLGEDLPRGVARQWADWCLHPDYLISEHLDARERFARFDAPTLFYSFTDDEYAPEAAVAHLLRRLRRAPVEHVRLAPEERGADAIGHFGFFRPRFSGTLWQEAASFLRESLAGRTPHHTPSVSAPATLSLREEVMADLRHGRP
jgi:predicted alpha/beta hydrolase